MTRYAYRTIILLAFVTSMGCTRLFSPTIPGVERGADVFTPTAQPIFGIGTSGNWQPHFHDIALAQAINVGGGSPGQAMGGNNTCVAVTLNRSLDADPTGRFKPIFRWLDRTMVGVNGGPFWVTQRDFFTGGADLSDYRSVSCAVAHDFTGTILDPLGHDDRTLELLVCYQVRLPDSIDWDIGVTALQWRGDNVTSFWTNEPTDRWDLVFNDQGAENDDLNPDIAYNHLNGDVYLVWSNVEDNPSYQRIKYLRYDRALNIITPEYYAQTVDPNAHNGHDPSIDVDLVDLQGGTRYYVAIAYTSQWQGGHAGYHVCYTGFSATPPADGNHNTTEFVRNPAPGLMNLDAGHPSIDIAPNANPSHIIAIAFEQVTGSDGFGPITSIYVKQVQGLSSTSFFQVPPGGNYFDGMNPSLAIERQGSLLDPITASVSFMAQSPQTDAVLNPYGRRVQLSPTLSLGTWLDLAPAASIAGNYNLSDTPFINPGMSTAIVTFGDSSYWAAWCDRTEMEPPPQEVWAAWGFI